MSEASSVLCPPTRRPRVLVMADWYAPGFRAGGPIRSTVNFAAQLEDELDIYVLTTDRDLGQTAPYAGVKANCWVTYGRHRVCYLSPSRLGWRSITGIIREVGPDVIYLNSMFSRIMTIYPLLFARLGGTTARILLAPRGMLMASALAVKPVRKRVFLNLLRWAGIARRIRFQATNRDEVADICRYFGSKADVVRIGNLPGRQPDFAPPVDKQQGSLRMVFVGRAHPIKQLDFLLRVLSEVQCRVWLTVVMTREDDAYTSVCRQLAAALPAHISVDFREDVPHEAIEDIIRANHIFALPTRGENFGHSIYEALAVGRPVLISDQTPWRDLARLKAGWDLPLDDADAFRQRIEAFAGADLENLTEWCSGAWELARMTIREQSDRKLYITQCSTCISLD